MILVRIGSTINIYTQILLPRLDSPFRAQIAELSWHIPDVFGSGTWFEPLWCEVTLTATPQHILRYFILNMLEIELEKGKTPELNILRLVYCMTFSTRPDLLYALHRKDLQICIYRAFPLFSKTNFKYMYLYL